jgi:hypothetical protein
MDAFYMHQYTFGKVVWRIFHFTYNSCPPTNVKNMLENWLNGIHKMIKARIRIRVLAFFGLFGNIVIILFLIELVLQTFCRLSLGYSLDQYMGSFALGASEDQMVAQEFYNQAGWRHSKRLQDA